MNESPDNAFEPAWQTAMFETGADEAGPCNAVSAARVETFKMLVGKPESKHL